MVRSIYNNVIHSVLINCHTHLGHSHLSSSLFRSMLLSTSLSFSSTQFPEDIDSPTERIIVPGVLVQLVKCGKLLVGDDEIYIIC